MIKIIKLLKNKTKRFLLSLFYPSWKTKTKAKSGYTIVVPVPMDMPFLTYFALKGLQAMDLTNCHEILVVPDGCGTDNGAGLIKAIELAGVPRVKLLPVTRRNKAVIFIFGDSGIAHWMTIVEAINNTETKWIFLHDADAFFTDACFIEEQYSFCKSSELNCLGVTSRWDPYFSDKKMSLPGTWELLFSVDWARAWSPICHKAGNRSIDSDIVFFDTMLCPMYCDYDRGHIQVRENDSFIHLNGTIVTYRRWLDHSHQSVGDENYRLLFLRLLKDLAPPMADEFKLPSIEELTNGIDDATKSLHYRFPDAALNYQQFRSFVNKLIILNIFRDKHELASALLKRFDDQFLSVVSKREENKPKMRAHGLYININCCLTI